MTNQKILKIFIENKDGNCCFVYFLKIRHGRMVVTQDVDSATRYKNTHGARIARGFIRRWGHDELIIIEDLKEEASKQGIKIYSDNK